MNLGPFWCVEVNAWLKFTIDSDRIVARVAKLQSNQHELTTSWEPITSGLWHVIDAEQTVHKYYQLKDNHLFELLPPKGKFPRARRQVEVNGKNFNWVFVRLREDKDLETYGFPDTLSNCPLPLHPDKIEEKWKILQQTFNYESVIQNVQDNLNEQQKRELVTFIPTALLGFNIKYFNSVFEYLEALREIIVNKDNVFHQQLYIQAGRTVDYPCAKDLRVEDKFDFFVHLLILHYNSIRLDFKLTPEYFSNSYYPNLESLDSSTNRALNISKQIRAVDDISQYYAHANKARSHQFFFFSFKASDKKHAEKGDVLKTKILLNFINTLDQCEDENKLDCAFEALKKNVDYKILKRGQGIMTKMFHLQTSSVKGLKQFFDDKRNELKNSKRLVK